MAVAVVVAVGLAVGILVATNHSSSENRAADQTSVQYWQGLLAFDSSLPQEGFIQENTAGQLIGNDYWGQCHPSPTFQHQFDCPAAGTPQAKTYVLGVRQDIVRDETHLAAAEAGLRRDGG